MEVVKVLLAANAHAHVKTIWGETPLHEAVVSRQKETIDVLLAAGADPNYVRDNGDTPLHAIEGTSVAAALAGEDLRSYQIRETHVVKALLAAGADVTVSNQAGNSAIDSEIVARLVVMEKIA